MRPDLPSEAGNATTSGTPRSAMECDAMWKQSIAEKDTRATGISASAITSGNPGQRPNTPQRLASVFSLNAVQVNKMVMPSLFLPDALPNP